MSIANLDSGGSYVVCVGLPLDVCSEVARVLGPTAVVVAAPDTTAAREMFAGVPDTQPVRSGPQHALPPGEERRPHILRRGPLRVNLATREVSIGGVRVHLSMREFDLLAALASETDRVWSFAELTRNVWRTGYFGDTDVVVSTVKRLRKRLTAVGGLEVASVRGVGYRLKIAG